MRPSYVWTATAKPLAIHISLDVVSRLGLQALEAYKAVPRRGLEIGGLLLGRVETAGQATTIYIDDFDPVDSEHRSGPSYLLSETDREHLGSELSSHPNAVGVYRTQTRSQTMELQADDVDVFEQFFSSPDRLFLMIRPADSMAEIFLPEDGRLIPVHHFSFRAADLSGEPAAIVVPDPAPVPPRAAALEAARVAAVRPPDPPPRRQAPRKWSWLVAAAALAAGAVSGALIYHYFPYRRPPAMATTAPPSPRPAPAPHVALEVQRDGKGIRLFWDRNSPIIRSAAHAVLYIEDGNHQSVLDLDARELNSGMVSYWPETQDVNFRLDVFSPHQSTEDSIRVVGAPQTPAPPRAAVPKPAAAEKESVEAAVTAPAKPKPVAENHADREASPPDTRPSPFQPEPKPATPPPPVISAAAATHPPGPTRPLALQPEITVTADPVTPSRFGAVIGKIPLLRRLRKQRAQFVPPKPIREPRPALDAAARQAITHEVPVDVKVYITKSGEVDYAELISGGTGRQRSLGAAAVYTARHWSFTPALLGDEAVASEAILKFRFGPPPPPPPAGEAAPAIPLKPY